MAMLGGLDCIAMAVEHLERASSSSAQPPPPPPPPSAGGGPPLAPLAFSRAVSSTSHTVCEPGPAGYAQQAQLPTQSSFGQQYRVVSDAEVESRGHRAAPTSAAVKKSDSSGTEFVEDDSKQIEELRMLIFQTDLSKWNKLPVISGVISDVSSADVLCGRGGETNHHKGNITFRACVRACQPAYIEAKRREKPYIAQRIVVFIRQMGGRFLKREKESAPDAWKDVGNNKAREKTSQALREGAPELRGDPKEAGSTTTNSVPSVVPGAVSLVRPNHPYVEYGSIPNMVTVSSAYDPRLSTIAPRLPPVLYPNAGLVAAESDPDEPTRRRASKKQRRVSYYAEAAGAAVLAHVHHQPTAGVPATSESSFPSPTKVHDHQPGPSPGLPSPAPAPHAPGYRSEELLVPGSPRVTVSADEEEPMSPPSPAEATSSAASAGGCRDAELAVPAAPAARAGPRLKLLKKRLLSEDSMSTHATNDT